MTPEEADEAFAVYERVQAQLRQVVAVETAELTKEQADYVRDRLSSEMRYWA